MNLTHQSICFMNLTHQTICSFPQKSVFGSRSTCSAHLGEHPQLHQPRCCVFSYFLVQSTRRDGRLGYVNFNKCESSAQRNAMAMLWRGDTLFRRLKGRGELSVLMYYVRNYINTLRSSRIHELPKSTVRENALSRHLFFCPSLSLSSFPHQDLFRHFPFRTSCRQLSVSSSNAVPSSHTNRKSNTCRFVKPGEQ